MPSTLNIDLYGLIGARMPGVGVTVSTVGTMLENGVHNSEGIVYSVPQHKLTDADGQVSFTLISSEDFRVATQYRVKIGDSLYTVSVPNGPHQLYDLLASPAGDHNRYLALGADQSFTAADYEAGTIFTANVVTFPTFTTPLYPAVTVPTSSPITQFIQLGTLQQDITGFFVQVADIDVAGEPHNQWVGTRMFPVDYSGVRMRVT